MKNNKQILEDLKKLIRNTNNNNFETTRSIEEGSAKKLSYNQNKTNDFAKSSETMYDKLLSYALRILGIKRYSREELRQKLLTASKKYAERNEDNSEYENCNNINEYNTEIVGTVLNRLTELKYLDEKEYIKDFVEFRLKNKPRGLKMLKLELKKRKLPASLIEEYFNSNNIDEIEIAESLMRKLENKLIRLSEKKQKEKIFSYLSSKGLSVNAIYKILNKKYSNSVDRI